MPQTNGRVADGRLERRRAEQRCATYRHLMRVRVAASIGWFAHELFFGTFGRHADFRLNAPLIGAFAAISLGLYIASMRSATILQRSWLAVPLLDLPVIFIAQYRGTPLAFTPVGNAVFATAMLAIIVVMSQLTMSVVTVLLTAGATIVLEIVLMQRAGLTVYAWLAAFIVLSTIGLTSAVVVNLFSALLREVVSERTQLACEIHDTFAQSLTAIAIHLENVAVTIDDDPAAARHHLDRARTVANNGVDEARRSVAALRNEPLPAPDLCEALRDLVHHLTLSTHAPIQLAVIGPPRRLSADVQSNLLRIAQEALTNAARHAAARSIEVQLRFERRRVILRVRDDGHGFAVATAVESEAHFGLVGMRERAERLGGSFEVRSAEGRGTEVLVAV